MVQLIVLRLLIIQRMLRVRVQLLRLILLIILRLLMRHLVQLRLRLALHILLLLLIIPRQAEELATLQPPRITPLLHLVQVRPPLRPM